MAKTHFSGPLYVGGVEVINENGKLVAQTDLTEILDANDNEMLEFDTVASAVNFTRLANAATGNNPALSAQGDDTNVDLQLSSKGTGKILLGSSGAATAVSGSATINAQRGVLTLGGLSADTASVETVDLLNDKIATDSQIQATLHNVDVTAGIPVLSRINIGTAGSATITIANADSSLGGSALAGTANIQFVVLN